MAVGREYPLTVLVRRLCMHDGALAPDLFGRTTCPNLFQYDPGVGLRRGASTASSSFTVRRRSRSCATDPRPRRPHPLRARDRGPATTTAMTRTRSCASARLRRRGHLAAAVPLLLRADRRDGQRRGANVYPENVAAVLARLDDTGILGYKLARPRDGVTTAAHDPRASRGDACGRTSAAWLSREVSCTLIGGGASTRQQRVPRTLRRSAPVGASRSSRSMPRAAAPSQRRRDD